MAEIRTDKIEIFNKQSAIGENMSQIKMDQSKSYRELLLANLKDAEHAAGYLQAALEEQDCDPTFLAKLLQSVIQDVILARYSPESAPQELKQRTETFYQAVSQSDAKEIYSFVELLNLLGFEISIRPKNLIGFIALSEGADA
jgi:DNA-binding phage protein